ncbi:hypothetical protein OH768_40775 [Streptomyces sp. NBC_01622]|nr:hypothetical protein OH768_40775 [Streptomyces sp. NBC_01622]
MKRSSPGSMVRSFFETAYQDGFRCQAATLVVGTVLGSAGLFGLVYGFANAETYD